MSVRICLTCRQDSLSFSDRILECEPGEGLEVGRADTLHRADTENAFFNCKVLSKRHAKFFYKGNKVFLKDLGSTNGTFINKVRLSRPGKPSKLREVFHGDVLQFGSLVTQIQPIIATLSITDMDGVNHSRRARNSVVFTPAASQEDITVLSSEESDLDTSESGAKGKTGEEEDWQLSKESMLALREKLLEMQRGMEFLSVKERDYEELQLLAEEEAETICELEKENYKLRNALINIENRISHEKEKYMRLAECEAETICNLEKENFKLSDMLSQAEEKLKKEKEKYKVLETTHLKLQEDLNVKENKTNVKVELQGLKMDLWNTQMELTKLKKENEKFRLEERLDEATESDLDLLIEKKEFRTESQVTANKDNLEKDNNEVLRSKNDVDKILSFVFAFIAFLFGLTMSEIEIPIGSF